MNVSTAEAILGAMILSRRLRSSLLPMAAASMLVSSLPFFSRDRLINFLRNQLWVLVLLILAWYFRLPLRCRIHTPSLCAYEVLIASLGCGHSVAMRLIFKEVGPGQVL